MGARSSGGNAESVALALSDSIVEVTVRVPQRPSFGSHEHQAYAGVESGRSAAR